MNGSCRLSISGDSLSSSGRPTSASGRGGSITWALPYLTMLLKPSRTIILITPPRSGFPLVISEPRYSLKVYLHANVVENPCVLLLGSRTIRRMGVRHLRRKLVDKELLLNMNVRHFGVYLTMSLNDYLTAQEMNDKIGMSIATLYHWLDLWEKVGLIEKIEYGGNKIRTRYQYRRLYNRIAITKDGVLFELVKEG